VGPHDCVSTVAFDRDEVDADRPHGPKTTWIAVRIAHAAGGSSFKIKQQPPEHFLLAAVDPTKRIPRAGGALHLDDHKAPAVGAPRQKVGLVAPIARTAPVSRDHAIAKRPQEPFRGAFARIPPCTVREDTHPTKQERDRDSDAISPQMADDVRQPQ
jgi:hypothetical protein